MSYYDEIADGYDALHGEEQDTKLAEFLDKVDLRQGTVVLDVGCGTGRSQQMLHEMIWHGIDPSAGLIAKAPAEARLRITQGIAESLPWPDASFDIVLSLTALQNFTDPSRGLAEIARVLKPKGTVLLSFLKKSSHAKEFDRLVRKQFVVREMWEQAHDLMYILVAEDF